jgi:hypothetical protein
VGKFGKEFLGTVIRGKRKLGRKNEGVAKNGFSRRKVGMIMRSGTIPSQRMHIWQ